jgi:hypothetical protein
MLPIADYKRSLGAAGHLGPCASLGFHYAGRRRPLGPCASLGFHIAGRRRPLLRLGGQLYFDFYYISLWSMYL